MKKVLFITLALTFVTIIFQSNRNKNDSIFQSKYSCNPQIEDWVKVNFDEIQKMSRSQISAIEDVEKRVAIFRSFDSQKKYEIWVEKFNYLMSSSDFSNSEKDHIAKLFTKLSPEIYISQSLFEEALNFYKDWSQECKSKFFWDEVTIAFVSQTWMTKAELQTAYTKVSMSGNYLPDCNCLSSWWCVAIGKGYCEGGSSCGSSGGCGLFNNQTCTGVCTLPND